MARTETPQVLLTLGYEGLDIESFVAKLRDTDTRALADVRKNPVSRKKGFSKRALSERLAVAGIEYRHFAALGVPSQNRRDLDPSRPETYTALFDYYETEILPAAAESLDALQQLLQFHGRVALMCFEADPDFCHRSRLADILAHGIRGAEPASVVHL